MGRAGRVVGEAALSGDGNALTSQRWWLHSTVSLLNSHRTTPQAIPF